MMALKRKGVVPPLADTLDPKGMEAKKGKFDDVCRICATPATAFSDFIDIFGVSGENLKLSSKINKFLPINVDKLDGFPHSICINCKDILIKMDHLHLICEKTDAYFHGQMHVEQANNETEPVKEVAVEDHTIVTGYNFGTNIPTFDVPHSAEVPTIDTSNHCLHDNNQYEVVCNSELPTAESSDFLHWVQHCNSESGGRKEETPTMTQNVSVEPTMTDTNSVEPTLSITDTSIAETTMRVTERNIVDPAMSMTESNSVEPTMRMTETNSVEPTMGMTETNSVEATMGMTETNSVEPTMSMTENIVEPTMGITETNIVEITTTKSNSVEPTVNKRGRLIKGVKHFGDELNDIISITEDERYNVSDDPDFTLEEENRSTRNSASNEERHSKSSWLRQNQKFVMSNELQTFDFAATTTKYNSVTALISKKLPFACDYCTEMIETDYFAECHYRVQHNMYLCPTCFVHCETYVELVQHTKEEHPFSSNYIKLRMPGYNCFSCKLCNYHFISKYEFLIHMEEKHQKFICYRSGCLGVFNNQSEYKDYLKVENQIMVCRICKIDFPGKLFYDHLEQHYFVSKVTVVMPTEKKYLESMLEHIDTATGVPVEITELACSYANRIETTDNENTEETSAAGLSNSEKSTRKKLPFPCEFCDKELTNITTALDHYNKLHEMHLCNFCFNHFPTKRELEEHSQNLHTFSCAICPFKVTDFTTNSLQKHLISAHPNINFKRNILYQCGICDIRLKSRTKLKSHMCEIHEKFLCNISLKCYNDTSSYSTHLKLEGHELKSNVCRIGLNRKQRLKRRLALNRLLGQDSDLNVEQKIEVPTYVCVICNSIHHKLSTINRHYTQFHNKFFCPLCNLVFDTHSDIDTHSLEVHGCNTSWSYRCFDCGQYFESKKNITIHVKSVHLKIGHKFACEECGKEFQRWRRFIEHTERIHKFTGIDEKVLCVMCKKYLRSNCIQQHLKRHREKEEFECDNCSKKIDMIALKCPHCQLILDETNLKKHIDYEHVEEWSYNCNICEEKYNTDPEICQHLSTDHCVSMLKYQYEYHRTYSHQCEICHNYQANASKLKMHMAMEHKIPQDNIDTDPTMKCDACGGKIIKKYESKLSKIPLKYPCNICKHSFRTEESRTKHVTKFHTEQRNIFCDVCKRGFKTVKEKNLHKKRVHVVDEKLPCLHCEKKFKSRDSLKQHIKKLHPENK